jgi:ribonucleotide reductase alpha subunit
MLITKRNNKLQTLQFDKITARIGKLCYDLDVTVIQPQSISQKVIAGLYDQITTRDVDNLIIEVVSNMISNHPDFDKLATRIAVSRLHKETKKTFLACNKVLFDDQVISNEFYQNCKKYNTEIQKVLDPQRDFIFTYFGFKTLERSYLLKNAQGKVEETPQFMYMRVAIGLYPDDLEKIKRTYLDLSSHLYTHATPTLFNIGTRNPQLASCFLMQIQDDSIKGIYKTVTDCALISKNAGGIGVSVHNVRGLGSRIKGTNGISNGLVPMLQVFNHTARYVDQGGQKRKGSIAIYIEPWHCDILDVLKLKRNGGAEDLKTRDLFYGLWCPDLFMKRVENNGVWSLFDPIVDTGANRLAELYGDDFEKLYTELEEKEAFSSQIPAKDLWKKILETQIETGMPYVLFKDTCNKYSNQNNLGTIKSSNLCVAGDTVILTSRGFTDIKSLNNKPTKVWNGYDWSFVIPQQTGIDQKLFRVYTSDGLYVDATEYHKFFIYTNGSNTLSKVETKQLKPGTQLFTGIRPIIHYSRSIENAYDLGIMRAPVQVDIRIKDRIEFLNGLFFKGRLQLVDIEYARNVLLLLHTLGCCSSKITYLSENQYEILFSLQDLQHLRDLNFTSYIQYYCDPELKIVDVEPLDGVFDTYCFTEPNRGMGVFNGILTGNCAEIVEYTSPEDISVCNLASISLKACVETQDVSGKTFNFDTLRYIVGNLVENLNNVIDTTMYPLPETKNSNSRDRPIGIGIQGLANVFFELGLPFTSQEARVLNKQIAEVMYHTALKKSCELAKEHGPYTSYPGSYLSKGIFQHELYGANSTDSEQRELICDWETLRADILRYGVRNSLCLALMPTASTSQIMNNIEAFEPITSNIYSRKVLSGDFQLVNSSLVYELISAGMWNDTMKNTIIKYSGSIQHIDIIPQRIKDIYKTVWEIKTKDLIDMAADRQLFIDQSQSFNIFMDPVTISKLHSSHFYSWKKGLKTGMYYLRTRPATNAIQFTIDQSQLVCSIENKEACEMCSS